MLPFSLENTNNTDVYTLWWMKIVSALPHQSEGALNSLPILTSEMITLFVIVYLLIFIFARWQQREEEKRS